jgi:hypothetical protein
MAERPLMLKDPLTPYFSKILRILQTPVLPP